MSLAHSLPPFAVFSPLLFTQIAYANMFYELRMNMRALGQNYPPKPKFHTDQIPDLTGRVMIVTGMHVV